MAIIPSPDYSGESIEWREIAACKGSDTGMFFPLDLVDITAAKAICNMCDVKVECLNFAQSTHQPDGVWGGEIIVAGEVLWGQDRRSKHKGDSLKTDDRASPIVDEAASF